MGQHGERIQDELMITVQSSKWEVEATRKVPLKQAQSRETRAPS